MVMFPDFFPRLFTGLALATIVLGLFFYWPLGLSLFFVAVLVGVLVYEWPTIGRWWITPWYPVLPCMLLIALNQGPERKLVLFVFGLSALFDSGGYFFGTLFGRHKVAPVLSPRKTWEGLIAGFVTAYVTSPVLMHLLDMKPLGWFWFPFITLYCCLAFSGDLIVSYFKRSVNVKDSSNLLPGHGGLLDRLASILPTVVLVYLLKSKLI